MKYIKMMMCAIILFSFTGCIQSEIVIKLKKNGSGTIEETVLLGNAVHEMIDGMMSSFGGDSASGKKDDFALLDQKKLKKAASEMGEGVRLVSAEEYATDSAKGYKAVYSFKDINKVKINQNPGDNVPSKPGEKKSTKPEFLSFVFKKGDVATLKILHPEPKEKKVSQEKDTSESGADKSFAADEKAVEVVKQMFEGMRIAISIDLEGTIVETNATHVHDATITIMEMDFARLLDAPEKLAQFAKVNPGSVEDAKKLIKDIPGMKVDMNDEIVVKFK